MARPLARPELPQRDSKLIILATEDRYAVEQYFNLFRINRIKVHVIPTEDCNSSPAAVLARLDGIRERFDIGEEDQLWLVLDTDHWTKPSHIANFREVIQKCRQKKIRIAISNPCFEIWVLFHVENPSDVENLFPCRVINEKLKLLIPGFDKSNLKIKHFGGTTKSLIERATLASQRAEARDQGHDWPNEPGTQVHLIFSEIAGFLDSESS